MPVYDTPRPQTLDDARRRVAHAARETIPFIRLGLTTTFAGGAAATTGTTQAACAVLSAVFGASAIRSFYQDKWFWQPALDSWLDARRSERATPPSP